MRRSLALHLSPTHVPFSAYIYTGRAQVHCCRLSKSSNIIYKWKQQYILRLTKLLLIRHCQFTTKKITSDGQINIILIKYMLCSCISQSRNIFLRITQYKRIVQHTNNCEFISNLQSASKTCHETLEFRKCFKQVLHCYCSISPKLKFVWRCVSGFIQYLMHVFYIYVGLLSSI